MHNSICLYTLVSEIDKNPESTGNFELFLQEDIFGSSSPPMFS